MTEAFLLTSENRYKIIKNVKKIRLQRIFFHLATNGQSDKAFLLTSKLSPQKVDCPCSGPIYMFENVKKVQNSLLAQDSCQVSITGPLVFWFVISTPPPPPPSPGKGGGSVGKVRSNTFFIVSSVHGKYSGYDFLKISGVFAVAQSDLEKAEEFNGQFTDVFNKNEHTQVQLLDRSAPFMNGIAASKDGVIKLHKGLNPSKALGLMNFILES